MHNAKTIMITLVLVLTLPLASLASDSNRELVEPFYTKILSRSSGADVKTTAEAILGPDWKSIGDYSGEFKSRDKFIVQFEGFTELIPNLTWKIEEMIVSGNRVVVRGRGTGSPVGKFFGVDPEGRSFDILTIDIHTIENGKVVNTYHVEDWLSGMAQLRGQK